MTPLPTRRYDLDWLRIIAFGLLIFYHIGMFYVSWDFHVKSIHAGPFLEPVMKLVNPWRMTVLFIISGIALRYAIEAAPIKRFLWTRFWRLFLPLVFGIHVIVAPQSWLELLQTGEVTSGFWPFYMRYLAGTQTYSIIVPTWNHLWYLAYLIVYSFILAGIYLFLPRRNSADKSPRNNQSFWLITAVAIIPIVIFASHENWLEDVFPSTHALINDWGNHALYFPFILLAFLTAKSERVWEVIDKLFWPACLAASALAVWQLFVWTLSADDVAALPHVEVWALLHSLAEPIYAWACILAALGLCGRFANRPSRALTYMTEAIFSWYILHQTIIIMAGVWLTQQAIPAPAEFALVTAATLLGCGVIHEFIIRRSRLLRPLFGLKNSPRLFKWGQGITS